MSQNGQETGRVEGWHLSRSVPISLIFALFMQSAAIVWWASGVNSTLEQLTQQFQESKLTAAEENAQQWREIRLATQAAQSATERSKVSEALVSRIEDDIREIKSSVRAVLDKIDKRP